MFHDGALNIVPAVFVQCRLDTLSDDQMRSVAMKYIEGCSVMDRAEL